MRRKCDNVIQKCQRNGIRWRTGGLAVVFEEVLKAHLCALGIAAKIGIVQAEAERRWREAGVKQSMKIRLRSCMYNVYTYIGMWV